MFFGETWGLTVMVVSFVGEQMEKFEETLNVFEGGHRPKSHTNNASRLAIQDVDLVTTPKTFSEVVPHFCRGETQSRRYASRIAHSTCSQLNPIDRRKRLDVEFWHLFSSAILNVEGNDRTLSLSITVCGTVGSIHFAESCAIIVFQSLYAVV